MQAVFLCSCTARVATTATASLHMWLCAHASSNRHQQIKRQKEKPAVYAHSGFFLAHSCRSRSNAELLSGFDSGLGSFSSLVSFSLGGVNSLLSSRSNGFSSRCSSFRSGYRSFHSRSCSFRSGCFHSRSCRCHRSFFLLAASDQSSRSDNGCQDESVLHIYTSKG